MTVLFKNKLLKPLQVGLLCCFTESERKLSQSCEGDFARSCQSEENKSCFQPTCLYLRAFGTFCLNKRLFFVIHEGVLTNKEVEQISIVGSMLWDV